MKTIIKTIILFTLFFSVDCIAQDSHKPSNVQVLGDNKTRAGRRELRREKKQHHAMMVLASKNEKHSMWARHRDDNSKYNLVSKRQKRHKKDLEKENPQEKKVAVRGKLKEPSKKASEQQKPAPTQEEVTQNDAKIKG
jgi:hypothetical protein